MDFDQIGMADKQIFRSAFSAGWSRYRAQYAHNEKKAADLYMSGPVAMARLIARHGGMQHEKAAAASLAGPSLFCKRPDGWMQACFGDFYREINRVNVGSVQELSRVTPLLSLTARLFLQASAVMLLDYIIAHSRKCSENEKHQAYREALDLYSITRGCDDMFRLDEAFEQRAARLTADCGQSILPAGFIAPSGGGNVHF